jgi:iron(III) transport system permease protein
VNDVRNNRLQPPRPPANIGGFGRRRFQAARAHANEGPVTSLVIDRVQARPLRRSTPGPSAPSLLLVSVWGLLALVIFLLAFIVYMSFVPGLPTDGGWTLDNWQQLGSTHFLTRVLPNTALLGLGSIMVAGAFGLPIAWLLNRTDVPMRGLLTTLMAVMVVMPGYVKAMGWVMLIDPQIGLINQLVASLTGMRSVPLTVSGNLFGMIWVIGLMLAPAIFFLVAGPVRALDPTLEESALMSGARNWRILRRIHLPLLWPSLLGALIYVFISAVSNFEIPALLGGGTGKVPVLSTALFYAIRPAGPQTGSFAYGVAGVYGLVLALPCLIAMYFYLRLLAKSDRYQVITGKGYRLHDNRLGGYRWLGFGFVVFYFLLSLVLPLLVLGWVSFLPVLQMPSMEMLERLSLHNYQDLFVILGGAPVFLNTLYLVCWVAGLVTLFSVLASWVVVRTRLRQRQTIDVLCMMPHAIPGLAFAFALTMLGIVANAWMPALAINGTLAVIVVAHVILRLPYGTRLANASLAQIHKDLEESAQMSGAGHTTIMLRVLLPLVRPSIIYLAVWTALLTLQEVSVAMFLSGPRNVVLSVNIFQLWTEGNMGPAAAATVVLTVAMSIATAFIFRMSGGNRMGSKR